MPAVPPTGGPASSLQPPTSAPGLSVGASGGMSVALLTLISQFLWHRYQFEMPNESWMAVLTIMIGVAHWGSRCYWCQWLLGNIPFPPGQSPAKPSTQTSTEPSASPSPSSTSTPGTPA